MILLGETHVFAVLKKSSVSLTAVLFKIKIKKSKKKHDVG